MATTKRRSEPSTNLKGTGKKFKSGNVFSWTDDETELLLGVAENSKSDKQAEWIDWESVKTKHKDIHNVSWTDTQICGKQYKWERFQASGFILWS